MRNSLILLTVLALAVPAVVGTTSANHELQIRCLTAPVTDATGLGDVTGVLCPDLWVDPARFMPYKETRTWSQNSCDVVEGHSVAGTRTLLRFTFVSPNKGLADLVVGSPVGNPNFYYSTCHNHYHFVEYADYRLWTPAQYAQYDALRIADPDGQAHEVLEAHPELQPVRGDKRGFCVIDIYQYGPGVPKWLGCDNQGISVNWADVYSSGLSGQYIDITGVPSGQYVLEAEVNSEHLYEESDYDNNRASRTVTI